jgi:GNAT superfamily N-acetyltransferase
MGLRRVTKEIFDWGPGSRDRERTFPGYSEMLSGIGPHPDVLDQREHTPVFDRSRVPHIDRKFGAPDLTFRTTGDAVGDWAAGTGEYHQTIYARDEEGQHAGSIQVSHAPAPEWEAEHLIGPPHWIWIQHVEVPEEMRRKGHARELFRELARANPGVPIRVQGDFETEEGGALRAAMRLEIPAFNRKVTLGGSDGGE